MARPALDFEITDFRPGEDEDFVRCMAAASMAGSSPDWSEPEDHDAKTREGLRHARERGDAILIARDAQGPVGIHWLEKVKYPEQYSGADETWPFPDLNGKSVAYIHNTAVAERARRRGVAKALKTEGYRRAQAMGCVCVMGGVSIHNPVMQAVNEKEGFIATPPRDKDSVWIQMYRRV